MAEELYEVEYTDDDIIYYIDDESGKEIGFAVLEDGKEVEYYYADDYNEDVAEAVDTVLGAAHKVVEENPFVKREDVADLGRNLNAIAKENAQTMKAMQEIGNDFKEFADFLKNPFKPREEKPVEAAATSEPVAASAPAPKPKPVVVIEEE